jgi:hypothetical protein
VGLAQRLRHQNLMTINSMPGAPLPRLAQALHNQSHPAHEPLGLVNLSHFPVTQAGPWAWHCLLAC